MFERTQGDTTRPVYRHLVSTVKWLGLALLIGAPQPSLASSDAATQLERARRFEERLTDWQQRLSEGQAVAILLEMEEARSELGRDPRLHNLRGLAHAALGQPAEAIQQFEAGLRLDPTRPELHLNLAVALSSTGMTGRALSEFEQALELDAGSVEARLGLGHELLRLGRHDAALEALGRAQEQAPGDPRILRALAEAHDGASDPPRAVAAWRALETVAPSADSARRLGELTRNAAPDTARIHFEDCVDRDPAAVDCAEAAASIALEMGLPGTAARLLDLRLGAVSEVGVLNLLIAYQREGDLEALENVLRRREPRTGRAWGVTALARRAAGERVAALEAVQLGLLLEPDSPDLENLRGVLLDEAGDRAAAIAAWQRALELDPEHPEALENLASVRGAP